MPSATPDNRLVVIFDDGCSMCTRQARNIERADWFRRFRTQGYSTAVHEYPEVARGLLGDGLRVRFPDASVTVGMPAVRSIAMRTPAALFAWTLYLPGISHLAARAYEAIAARRTTTSCELPSAVAARPDSD